MTQAQFAALKVGDQVQIANSGGRSARVIRKVGDAVEVKAPPDAVTCYAILRYWAPDLDLPPLDFIELEPPAEAPHA